VLVELFYLDGCPSWQVAEERLTEALRRVGRGDVTAQRRLVESTEQAGDVGFTGSPTIRIDGTDPFATGSERVGLACRVYATPAGLSGSPTTTQLLEVLR
jgi:hypothetical protein